MTGVEALRYGTDGVLRSTGQTPGVVVGAGPNGTIAVNPGGTDLAFIDRLDAIAGAVDAAALVALANVVCGEWVASWPAMALEQSLAANDVTREATDCIAQAYQRLGDDFSGREVAEALMVVSMAVCQQVIGATVREAQRAEAVSDFARLFGGLVAELDQDTKSRRRWWRR